MNLLTLLLTFFLVTNQVQAQSVASDEDIKENLQASYDRWAKRNPLAAAFFGYTIDNRKVESFDPQKFEDDKSFYDSEIQLLENLKKDINENSHVFIDLEVLKNFFRHLRAEARLHTGKKFVVSGLNGLENYFISVVQHQKLESKQNLEDLFHRLSYSKKHVNELVNWSLNNFKNGYVAPLNNLKNAEGSIEHYLSGYPFDDSDKKSTLFKNWESKILLTQLTDKEKQKALEQIETSLKENFQPAFQKLLEHIRTLVKNSRGNKGLYGLTGSKEFYRFMVKHHTAPEVEPEQLFQMGVDRVDLILEQMELIKSEVGFEGSLKELFKFMKTDDQFYFSNDNNGREQYLNETRRVISEIRDILNQIFRKVPKKKLRVGNFPEALQSGNGGAGYWPSESAYLIDLSNMKALPKYELQVLAYHEGLPGHHMQFSVMSSQKERPEYRKHIFVTASGEGWGLYSENLAQELGLYKDPYSLFGKLNYEMLRALRLVIDVGVHYKGMSLEEAMVYARQNSGFSERVLRGEVVRYMTNPGQATAYMYGMLKIKSMRDEAKLKLKEKFDIREFHEIFLNSGQAPLAIVDKKVSRWVDSIR